MDEQITISKTLRMRDWYDENWLQGQIAAKPAILGLGELVFVEREKRQASGGRLDILLKSHDGGTLFEVEVMLGETDGSHISRTIEYWDLEQRQDPKRKHIPVLVAENVTRRFFNVIHRISHSIPIIAIKANIIDVEGRKALHFTTILDAYDESPFEDRAPREIVDEKYWQENALWTLAQAKALREIFSSVLGELKLHFRKDEIQLRRHDGNSYLLRLQKRAEGESSLTTWMASAEMTGAKALLESAHIRFKEKTPDSEWPSIRVTIDKTSMQENAKLFIEIAKLLKKSWQEAGEY